MQKKKCQHNEINNLIGTCFKSNHLLDKIKHSNEYKTFENKFITKSHRMSTKYFN